MKVVIIDDEVDARVTLSNFLKRKCSSVEIVGFGQSVKTGIESIITHKPDLIFLDIKMGDGTGFDLVNQTDIGNAKVVFTTAYNEFAIKAFRINAFDYLLKPINPHELVEVVNKYVQSFNNSTENVDIASKVNLKRGTRISINNGNSFKLIYSAQVIFIESDSSYSRLRLIDGRTEFCATSLGEYEKLLNNDDFYRIHNSYLVNCKYVEAIDKKENKVEMIDRSLIDISRRKKTDFIKCLTEMN